MAATLRPPASADADASDDADSDSVAHAYPTLRTKPLAATAMFCSTETSSHFTHFATVVSVCEISRIVAIGASDHSLRFFAVDQIMQPSLRMILALPNAHTRCIRDLHLCTTSPSSNRTFLSASEDGNVCAIEPLTCSYSVSSRLRTPDGQRAWSVAVGLSSNDLLALGTDDAVHFYWLKQGVNRLDQAEHIGSFQETFSQPVTQLSFNPFSRHTLFASSADGLVSVFDVHDELDDWDGVTGILSVGADVSSFGFFSNGDCVWCITRVEELSFWMEDGSWLGQLYSTRNKLSALHPERKEFVYLTACEWDQETGTLYLAASASDGELSVFPIVLNAGERRPQALPPVVRLSQGHSDIIRHAHAMQTDALGDVETITAAEDGLICLWGPRANT